MLLSFRFTIQIISGYRMLALSGVSQLDTRSQRIDTSHFTLLHTQSFFFFELLISSLSCISPSFPLFPHASTILLSSILTSRLSKNVNYLQLKIKCFRYSIVFLEISELFKFKTLNLGIKKNYCISIFSFSIIFSIIWFICSCIGIDIFNI